MDNDTWDHKEGDYFISTNFGYKNDIAVECCCKIENETMIVVYNRVIGKAKDFDSVEKRDCYKRDFNLSSQLVKAEFEKDAISVSKLVDAYIDESDRLYVEAINRFLPEGADTALKAEQPRQAICCTDKKNTILAIQCAQCGAIYMASNLTYGVVEWVSEGIKEALAKGDEVIITDCVTIAQCKCNEIQNTEHL